MSDPSNIRQMMTRIAFIGILLCHTLVIIIQKYYITINNWFELSVLPTYTFLPKLISQIKVKTLSEKDKYKLVRPYLRIVEHGHNSVNF